MSLTYVGKNGRVYRRKFDYEEARRRYAAGESQKALAAEYGVSIARMCQVLNPEVGRRDDERRREWGRNSVCPDCGARATRKRKSEQHRCRECHSRRMATTVRPDELRCITCKEWKPDDEFPSNRAISPHRRGRHSQCRSCQTIARRDHRRRNREADNAYQREYRRRRRSSQAGASIDA